MTAEEFNKWWIDFAASFPAVARWQTALPNSSDALCVWGRTLVDSDLADCLRVTQAMLDGQIEEIGPTDQERQSVARIVKKRANLFRLERTRAERIAAGGSTDPNDEPRYHCHHCRDKGIVYVMSPVMYNKGINDYGGHPIYDMMGMACGECSKGERYKSPREKSSNMGHWPARPVYDPAKHFRVADGITDTVIDEFEKWLETYMQNRPRKQKPLNLVGIEYNPAIGF